MPSSNASLFRQQSLAQEYCSNRIEMKCISPRSNGRVMIKRKSSDDCLPSLRESICIYDLPPRNPTRYASTTSNSSSDLSDILDEIDDVEECDTPERAISGTDMTHVVANLSRTLEEINASKESDPAQDEDLEDMDEYIDNNSKRSRVVRNMETITNLRSSTAPKQPRRRSTYSSRDRMNTPLILGSIHESSPYDVSSCTFDGSYVDYGYDETFANRFAGKNSLNGESRFSATGTNGQRSDLIQPRRRSTLQTTNTTSDDDGEKSSTTTTSPSLSSSSSSFSEGKNTILSHTRSQQAPMRQPRRRSTLQTVTVEEED